MSKSSKSTNPDDPSVKMNSSHAPLCKMEYCKDEKGQDVLLKEGKYQVMMEWEKPYMEACIDALKPRGDVLEVGFGMGYAANHIQSYQPQSHTIIEYHPEVLKRAKKWAEGRPHVTIIEGIWQEVLPTLGLFDSLFFDDYPLETGAETTRLELDLKHSSELLAQGNQLLSQVEKELPFLHSLRYSDSDLDQFFSALALDTPSEVKQVARFLLELFQGKQISQDQLTNRLQQLVKTGFISQKELSSLSPPKQKPSSLSQPAPRDRFYQFLSQALHSHMRIGSSFSCFLSSDRSRFEDETFFNEIILNPLLEFHEEQLELQAPDHCLYFDGTKPLVITITKKG